MLFDKFIIEDDELYIGRVTYHKELAHTKENVKGGGMWTMDRDKKEITLFGESQDFGRVTIEQVKECVKKGNIGTNYVNTQSLKDYKVYFTDYYHTRHLIDNN